MRRDALTRLALACQAVIVFVTLAAFTDVFVGTPPLLLLALPLVAALFVARGEPRLGLVFLAATLLIQFAGSGPNRHWFAVGISIAAVQALRWHLRGRVWNFRRLSRQSETVITELLPAGVTLQAEPLERPNVQGMRFQLYRDGKLAAVLVAVGSEYLRSVDRLEPVLREHKENIPRMVVPLEAAREPQVMRTLLGQMGVLRD